MSRFSFGLFLFLAYLQAVTVSGISDSEEGSITLLVDKSKTADYFPDVPWAYDVSWFQHEPEDSYAIKGKPATLTCQAASALKVYFKCKGQVVPNSKHVRLNYTHANTGALITEVQLNITKKDIEDSNEPGAYTCECVAWNKRGTERTRPVKIQIAYLKKYFEQNPYSKNVELDAQTEFRCIPPEGSPTPEISWERDGHTIEPHNGASSNYIITADGHLLIAQTKLADMGNYTCIAENLVMRRVSEPALLTVYVNGGWSGWSPWTDCQGPCGNAIQKRSRQCNNPAALNGGRPCSGPSYQKQDCHISCPPIDGGWSPWSPWSKCGSDCKQWRKRSCTNPSPSFDGQPCPVGKDLMSVNCTGGFCKGPLQPPHSTITIDSSNTDTVDMNLVKQSNENAKKTLSETDLVIYISLVFAIFVFAILAFSIVKLLRRKERNDLMYDLAPSDYPANYFGSPRKLFEAQPDLTATHNENSGNNSIELPLYYDNSNKDNSSLTNSTQYSNASTDHLYDVPHLHSRLTVGPHGKLPMHGESNQFSKPTFVTLTSDGNSLSSTTTNIFVPNQSNKSFGANSKSSRHLMIVNNPQYPLATQDLNFKLPNRESDITSESGRSKSTGERNNPSVNLL